MGQSPTTSELAAPLRCARCEYDLTGLKADSVCPECEFSIDESTLIARARPVRLTPLPVWLRYARSIYWASWAVCVSWPYFLPQLAEALGMPVLRRWSAVSETLNPIMFGTAILGIIVTVALIAHGRASGILAIFGALVFVTGVPAGRY